MTLKESGNCFLEISNLVEVQPRSKSVIIGVIDIPCFRMKNNFTVTGMVSYKVADELSSDDHQINLPCMSLGTGDLIKGDLIPFLNNQLSVQDIASVMAVFEKTDLEIILPEKHCNLDNIMDQLGYSKLVLPNCSPCFVNNSNRNNALSQSVLFLNTTSKDVHNFVCYTRNEHQLLLLAHSLLSLLPHKSQVLKKLRLPTSLDNAIDHLGSEISYLTDTLRSHILPCDGPLPDQCQLKFKADLWQEIRQKMCAYELETDFALQGLAT
ncbi:uncharacterized protein LOC111060570 [Nilaparvata lugens]|uniref:uncharacterized protein LOC111060570 n=1 Tax=Nilaparvata lugens TaxID=108931 RepID=UPI00193E8E0C|nr:uncharacterized protein LOC111060570 [Nilaparvata lugens]